MDVIDYSLSFISGNHPDNSPRLWVESRCRLIDDRSGTSEDYVQTGSCKSEDTFGEQHLFQEDNFDFMAIFGPADELVFRRKAYLNDNYRTIYPAGRLWPPMSFDYVQPPVVTELITNAQIRAATHGNLPLVSQTEIWNDQTGLRAIIEFPIKSMNIHNGKDLYQVDTGPVLFPDLENRKQKFVETVKLAYVAFNAPHSADFVCEVPTPIAEGGREVCRIYHFSQRHRLAAKNRIYCLGEPPASCSGVSDPGPKTCV